MTKTSKLSLHQLWLLGSVFTLPKTEGEGKMLRDGMVEVDQARAPCGFCPT